MSEKERGQTFLNDLAEARQDLPISAALLRDLFAQTRDDSTLSLEDVGKTISQDQTLTAKVLALANSAFYGLQAKITNVSRATALLGLKEIRNLVISLGIMSLAKKFKLPQKFDIQEYWRHNLATGIIAKVLALKIGSPDAQDMFTAGLLHDFGILLTAIYSPEDWKAIRRIHAKAGDMAYTQAEDQHWGIEHGLIGSMTLDAWNLPPELTEPVNWHHTPAMAPEHAQGAKIICLANGLDHLAQNPEYQLSQNARGVLAEFNLDASEILGEVDALANKESMGDFITQVAE